MKKIVTLLIFTVLSFYGNSQTLVSMDWSGRHCSGGLGLCGIEMVDGNEKTSNCELSYNQETRELTLLISKSKTDENGLNQLVATKDMEGRFVYNLELDLPLEIKSTLGISQELEIVNQSYFVEELANDYKLILKLE